MCTLSSITELAAMQVMILYTIYNLLHLLSQGYFQQGTEKSILYEANPQRFLKRTMIISRLRSEQFDQWHS